MQGRTGGCTLGAPRWVSSRRLSTDSQSSPTPHNAPHSGSHSNSHFYQTAALDKFASQLPRRLTLRQLAVFARNITPERLVAAANFGKHELTVRLARRIREFQRLPFAVGKDPHVEMAYDLYWAAFETFRKEPPINTLADNDRWCAVLRSQLDRHMVVIPQLALGFRGASKHMPSENVDKFMSGTLRSRIGRRVLAEHHLAMTDTLARKRNPASLSPSSPSTSPLDGDAHVGIVSPNIPAAPLVHHCASLAASRFLLRTGRPAPRVVVDGHTDAQFTYIRDHAEYVLYELISNAARFSDYEHGRRVARGDLPPGSEPPPIRVTVALSPPRDPAPTITFRVSDTGGGIPASLMPHLWSYSHPSKFSNFSLVPRMAGKVAETSEVEVNLGIGLPMCRVYAEYWGGSIDVVSSEGYGTDVYVVLGLGNRGENVGE
ncbi:alpha-ketoacid dehydrogenase kinase [Gonapodya prolifera JEL478]|uniref:Protein-serine/threonine kinase n=1 Tax=Gonapodya prolifera (strain JEL478) TaxID=1344416 RepID=A0A139AHI8_GONPJ|nr:alpha-ketoacid dehydrogenase kinase [Gonapodya prolifera JEL478]|eukprot:KXS16198.1 alpha-ketoacid dehydrogenase kinase [Gonapodya prolifera JEL478]